MKLSFKSETCFRDGLLVLLKLKDDWSKSEYNDGISVKTSV